MYGEIGGWMSSVRAWRSRGHTPTRVRIPPITQTIFNYRQVMKENLHAVQVFNQSQDQWLRPMSSSTNRSGRLHHSMGFVYRHTCHRQLYDKGPWFLRGGTTLRTITTETMVKSTGKQRGPRKFYITADTINNSSAPLISWGRLRDPSTRQPTGARYHIKIASSYCRREISISGMRVAVITAGVLRV